MIEAPVNAQAAWILGPAHLDALDVDGRPLGERASARYEEAARREKVRSFGDARDATELPCNHAAFAQLRGAWTEILAWLRDLDADRPATVERMHRRAFAAVTQAPLLALRQGRVSVFSAALFKTALGFSDLLARLLLEGRVDAADPPPSVEALDAWLDAEPWLVGERQVCAGSREQIRAAWRALAETGRSPHAEPDVDALLEVAALQAAAAGAARALVREVRPDDSLSARLYLAEAPPRLVRSLLQVEGAGPVHAALLFADPPPSLRAFLAALPDPADPMALTAVDAALVACSADPLARLTRSGLRAPPPPPVG